MRHKLWKLGRNRVQRLRKARSRRPNHEPLETRHLLAADVAILPPPIDAGDTLATAQAVLLEPGDDVYVTEMIGNNDFGPTDVDIYRLKLQEGDALRGRVLPVDFLGLPGLGLPPVGPTFFGLRVFDAAGNQLAVSQNIPLPTTAPLLSETTVFFEAPAEGEYFVGVSGTPNFFYDPQVAGSGEDGYLGGYELSLQSRRIDSQDVGDTIAQAERVLLEPNQGVQREEVLGNNEFGPADVDLYGLELNRGDSIAANLSSLVPVPANIALGAGVLRLFDETGKELAASFSAPLPLPPLPPIREPVFLDVSLDFVIPEDGQYYFGVSSFPNFEYDPFVANSGEGQHFGHYTLAMRRAAFDDIGDTLKEAKPIELSADRRAEISEFIGNNDFGPADVDLIRVALREGDVLGAHVFGLNPDAPLRSVLRTFDEAGNELGISHDGTAAAPENALRLLAPHDGIYYVGVSGFPNLTYDPLVGGSGVGEQTGGYRLVLERDRPPRQEDVGDTLQTAAALPLEPNHPAHIEELLGNNRFGASDVDLYEVQLREGDFLHAHLLSELVPPAGVDPFSPHGVLRLFDVAGNELSASKRVELPPGVPLLDTFVEYQVTEGGRYYIGVSSSPNFQYDPQVAGSGVGGGTGHYLLDLLLDRRHLPTDVGDTLASARFVEIEDNGVANVQEFLGNNEFGPSDVDMYSFELLAGDVFAATLNHPFLDTPRLAPGLGGGVLRAFDAGGREIAISGVPGADFSDIKVRFEVPVDGEYFVGVSSRPNFAYDPLVAGSGIGEDTGFYLVDVRVVSATGDDVGDTISRAHPLIVEPGQRLHVDEVLGNNSFGPLDVDIYHVDLQAGDIFRAHVVGVPHRIPGVASPYVQSVLRAFDAAGNPVPDAAVQFAGNDGAAGAVTSIEFVALESGAYFVGVSGFPNVGYDPLSPGSGVPGSVGRYFLAVDVDRVVATDDIGDVLATAHPVNVEPGGRVVVDEFLGNNAFAAADVDLYRLALAQGDALTAVLRHPFLDAARLVDLHAVLRVFDAAGNELAASLPGIELSNVLLLFTAPSGGNYYVGVSSLPNVAYDPHVPGSGVGETTGPYQLSLGVSRSQPNPDEAITPRLKKRLPRRLVAALQAMTKKRELAGGAAGRATVAAGAFSAPPPAAPAPPVYDPDGLELGSLGEDSDNDELLRTLAEDVTNLLSE